ncbi:hypothetical protein AB0E01_22875 [Nocardia vinacea]|uniref:hypothetical protein n=1 Tax=Nocardia vinacea TaxID=96468 RepID=UPI0033CE94F6
MSDTLPIEVTAEILPGKVDPNQTARFANGSRAAQYADMLIATGDFKSGGVWITDSHGTRHRIG